MAMVIGDIPQALARTLDSTIKLMVTGARFSYNVFIRVLFTRLTWVLRIVWRRIEIFLIHLSRLTRGLIALGQRHPEGMIATMIFLRDLFMLE